MSRATIAIDRFAVLVLALVLVAVGGLAAVWATRAVPPFTGPLNLAPIAGAADQTWWPWTVGLVGGTVAVLALRWLYAHVPRRGTGPIKLSGTDGTGRLLAEGGPVADAAAEAFGRTPGVRSARGRIMRERGQVVARVSASIDPGADLAEIAAAADEMSAQLRHVLGREDLTCRVQLKLAGRATSLPRVS